MRSIIVECGPYAAPSATNIRTATSATAGALVLNGSTVTTTTTGNTYAGAAITVTVATLDKPRRLSITSSGNDSNKTFTIVGTDWNNNLTTEVLTGGNATAAISFTSFKTVSSVTISATSAGTVSIGTNGYADSRPVFCDTYADASTWCAVDCGTSTAITYRVQQSGDDPNAGSQGFPEAPGYENTYSACRWNDVANTTLVNTTGNKIGEVTGVGTMIRVRIDNAGTDTTAQLHATFNQSGMVSF